MCHTCQNCHRKKGKNEMPLVAMNQKNERVELWRYSTEAMLKMRDKLKAGSKAYCPECGGEMTIKAINSPHYVAHFAHLPSAQSEGCEYGRGESQEHLAAKSAIANYISGFAFYAGATVHIEYKLVIPNGYKPTRRADVVAIMPTGDIHVHEAQLSRITTETLRERTSDYRQVSAEVVWWLGGNAERPENEFEAKLLSIFGRIAKKNNQTVLYSEAAFLSQLEKRKNMVAYKKELLRERGIADYIDDPVDMPVRPASPLFPKEPNPVPFTAKYAQPLPRVQPVREVKPLADYLKLDTVHPTQHGGQAKISAVLGDDLYITHWFGNKNGTPVENIDGVLYDLKWAGHGRDFIRANGATVTVSTSGKVMR
jgi:hypothetical protein